MKDKVNAIPLIGEIIKEELSKQGKTTVWLAEQLGCHRTNIYKVYGRATIDTGMLYHICQLLNIDLFKVYSDALRSAFMASACFFRIARQLRKPASASTSVRVVPDTFPKLVALGRLETDGSPHTGQATRPILKSSSISSSERYQPSKTWPNPQQKS